MHSHLDIEVKGQPLNLGEDFELPIEERNPLFYDNEMHSWPVPIPLKGNRKVLKNIDDAKADIRPSDLENADVRIIADGMPFKSGCLKMQEGEEVKDSLTLNVDNATLSFDDLIGDLECQDVPLKDDIQIGEKIGNVTVEVKYDYHIQVVYPEKKGTDDEIEYSSNDTVKGTFEPQALGFSYPAKCKVDAFSKQAAIEDLQKTRYYPNGHKVIVPQIDQSFINVTDAYPAKPYCNARIAYKHVGMDENGKSTGNLITVEEIYSNSPEEHYPYWVLDADRPQSGICFYVLYFLECLFTHLEVDYDLSALTAIEDLKHLAFFTTHCKYRTVPLHGTIDNPFFQNETDRQYYGEQTISIGPISRTEMGWQDYSEDDFNKILFADINKWLESRGCGGQLAIPWPAAKSVQDYTYKVNGGQEQHIVVGQGDVQAINILASVRHAKVSANILKMYATSENFPDVTVKEVLDSLENSFGIKFHYDYEQNKVTAYLLRDVFRSQSAPLDFLGKVTEMNKVVEKISGVRMVYSAESDSKEQRKNVKKGVKNYDTDYDYIDFPEDSTVTDLTYQEITQTKPVENLKTYIDLQTGNAYRWKASEEALEAGEYKCSLFQVATFKGVEIGDCSQQNEDNIKEFTSSFVPVPMSDVNYRISELMAAAGSSGKMTYNGNTYEVASINSDKYNDMLLSAFIDEEMEHEFVQQYINNGLPSALVNLYLTERLECVESYNPSQTDDGNSPLQHYDWGLAIALMQGGGTNAKIEHYDYNYDLLGNSRWRIKPGEYAMTSDSLDNLGRAFDYNGDHEGLGGGERFSLKIRAYQQPAWADAPLVVDDEIDEHGNVTKKIKTRGLYDSFMQEYAEFLLKRKTFKVRVEASVAQLNDITNHWRDRYRINGMLGWIGKMTYNISKSEGVKDVELEFHTM